MMIIRKETHEDIDAIKRVNDSAFNGDNEGKLVNSIRNSDLFIPELSLCAVAHDGEIIGHLLMSIVFIETKGNSIPTLALAPMAVLPNWQNKGIGTKLVSEGLLKARELGFQHVVVLGHPDFYPKFGFEKASSKGILPPFPVPEEVFMVMELQEGSLQGKKGMVKYPPSFDSVT
ncbi:GNAT family N-acetyltransferase [Bacillus salacetis]|uniref:GNAT family N-acetyltransferase n=1 Tax=Bacillus salacetis TaxID=2315464 RepID=UPI003B9E55CB